MSSIRLLHLADLHLGFTGHTSLIVGEQEQPKYAGRYLREVDIENTTRAVIQMLCHEQDPPVDIVVMVGDVFHRSTPLPHAIKHAAVLVSLLVQAQIEVVIVDGNHEYSPSLHTGNPLSFLQEMGAHVIDTSAYTLLSDQHWYSARLRNKGGIVIHALPHRAMRDKAFAGLHPLPDMVNVLIAHARVADTYEKNTLGRTIWEIPRSILRQGWDYVALGDWHAHGYQPLSDVPAYYAGSLEALNFGEATHYPLEPDDPYAIRGMLDVRLSRGEKAIVQTIAVPTSRPILCLEPIHALNMDAETLMEAIEKRLDSPMPPEALCQLTIYDYSLTVLQQLDHDRIQQLCSRVRKCVLRWIPQKAETQQPTSLSSLSLEEQWHAFVECRMTNEEERPWYIQEGTALLDTARKTVAAKRYHNGKEGDDLL
jgi:DNA repair exonuclease SbcCD nuclease subunit